MFKLRTLATTLAALAVAAGVGWSLLEPDWRNAIRYATFDKNVFTWSIEQRDANFRMFDRAPIIHPIEIVEAGDQTRDLPAGPLLDLGVDVDAFMADQRAAGLVILHNGEVRLERYGLGFSAEKRWTSFSVAKSLTSALTGAALADGAIESLDDPVTKYVPDLSGTPYDGVTVRQLLTMSSGVGWDENYKDPNSDVVQFVNHEPADGKKLIVSYMAGLPRAHEPGAFWSYSTGETTILGVVVESATGKTIAQYLSEKIWAPFGMESDASWMLASDGAEIAGCCIQATTRDFARFGLFMLEGGEAGGEPVFSRAFLEAATSQQLQTDERSLTGYGYQWWIPDFGGYLALGIYGQTIYVDPPRNLIIAMNGNWRSPVGDEDGEVAERFAFFQTVQAAVDAEAGR